MSKVSNFKLQVGNLNFSCNLSLKKKEKKKGKEMSYFIDQISFGQRKKIG